MSSQAMSFKARVNRYAKQNHLPAQVVLQNVMFERFLERLVRSKYRDKFVIKGGMLVSAIVGLDTRATMDLDTSLRNLALTEETVAETVRGICEVDLADKVTFKMQSILPIRKDDDYGGYRVRVDAVYEQIVTPLSIDISTGDVITPDAVAYEISGILDETVRIPLWGYSIETVLAEKIETILRRDVTSTRPRDYYDVYILGSKSLHDRATFHEALRATAEHRGTWGKIKDYEPILQQIEGSAALREMWEKYRKSFHYARDISYEDTLTVIREILK